MVILSINICVSGKRGPRAAIVDNADKVETSPGKP